MAKYSIKDLERLSNIKAHTIRIWEQRYGLLTPRRTDTNIRYYDDEQLKKLLNVTTLLDMGLKISEVSQLTHEEIGSQIDKLIDNTRQQDAWTENIINQILIACTQYDEYRFDKSFSHALLKFGPEDTYVKVIYPLMVRLGLMWSKDDVIPAQEHFISNLLKQKLFTAIDSTPPVLQSNQTWVLFLHEEEEHELGLLFASYLLRKMGIKVIYMGQRVPYENLIEVVKQCKATHVYTFFVRSYPKQEIRELLHKLEKDLPHIPICISGKEDTIGDSAREAERVIWLKDIQALRKFALPHNV